MTRLSVVDQFSTQSVSTHHRETTSFFDTNETSSGDLNERVLRAVSNGPFASIRDIRRELNRRPEDSMVSWWQLGQICVPDPAAAGADRAAGLDPHGMPQYDKRFGTLIWGNALAGSMPANRKLGLKLIADRATGRLLGAQAVGEVGAVSRINTLSAALWAWTVAAFGLAFVLSLLAVVLPLHFGERRLSHIFT